MIRALLYLRFMTLRGQIVSRVKRLKQPKYLFGGIVGAAYIYFVAFRRTQAHYGPPAVIPAEALPIIATVGALILLAVLALGWILPGSRASLAFTETEIAFLFPAPISRRTLIHYRLLNTQLGILFTALVVTLFSNRWSFLGGHATTHALGFWIVLATVNLHLMGASFVITRLLDRGISHWSRRLLSLGIIALIIGSTVFWVRGHFTAPSPKDVSDAHAFARYLSPLLEPGPLRLLLMPAKWLLAPMLATDLRTFALALVPSLLVLAAHYVWVLRAEVAFEEVSLAQAEKRAARIAAIRKGDRRGASDSRKARSAPFQLTASGRPEIAFLWKNLLSTYSFLRPRTALIAAGIITASCTWLARHEAFDAVLSVIGTVAMLAAAIVVLFGPQMARLDLRADLVNTDILKTYPLRGDQLLLGELLAPVAILTVFVWLAVLTAALAFHPPHAEWVTFPLRAGIAVALALIAPPLCAIQLLVPNAATLIFPAWSQATQQRGSGGLEVMGQRLIFLAGQLLVLVFALVPVAVGAAIAFFGAQWLIGTPAAALLALAIVLATLSAEVWLGLKLLGQVFERFDLSSELRP